MLNDLETGYPFACLEAAQISAARTAASAVLAAELLTRLAQRRQGGGGRGGVISRNILEFFDALGLVLRVGRRARHGRAVRAEVGAVRRRARLPGRHRRHARRDAGLARISWCSRRPPALRTSLDPGLLSPRPVRAQHLPARPGPRADRELRTTSSTTSSTVSTRAPPRIWRRRSSGTGRSSTGRWPSSCSANCGSTPGPAADLLPLRARRARPRRRQPALPVGEGRGQAAGDRGLLRRDPPLVTGLPSS
jgi:hypothetical protein